MTQNHITKILFLNIILISFIAGSLFSHFKPFPFGEMANFYRYSETHSVNKIQKYEIFSNSEFKEIESKINYVDKNPEKVRNFLKKKIINNNVIIKTKKYSSLVYTIKSKIYGVETKNVFTKSSKKSKCLNIYIHGHDKDPYTFKYYRNFLKHSINIRCDILTMSPIGYGLNEGISSFPTKRQYITLNSDESKIHSFYSYYSGSHDPLSLFLSGHYNIINNISKKYSKIAITGISGGGWYATWLAALLPQIDLTVMYAGSMPLKYHYANNQGDFPAGDWEQTGSMIYNHIDYWELYKLTLKSNSIEKKRKSYIIYNKYDPCCFRDPFSSNFKSLVDDVSTEMPIIIVDENYDHSINNFLIDSIYFKNNFK